MRKSLAVLWLMFTLLPLAYIAYFIMYMVSMWGIGGTTDFQQQQEQFDLLFEVHIATIVLIWILIASYIIYVFRTEHVSKDKKALWAVVLFMGSIVAMPVFWFLYVWKPLSAMRAEQAVQPDRA